MAATSNLDMFSSECLQGVLPESGAPSSLGSDGDEEAPVFKKIAEDGAKVAISKLNQTIIIIIPKLRS